MNLRLLLLPLLLASGSGALARVANRVLDPREDLFLSQNKNVKQVRSYLVQHDNWSCGLRCSFHAIAFERALQSPHNFEAALKQNLQDASLLNRLDSKYGNNHGLSNQDIMNIAQDFGFAHKITCLGMNKNNQINYLGNVHYNFPWGASQGQLHKIKEEAIKQKLQGTLKNLTSIAKNAPQAVYFVAGTQGHWILFALVNLPNKPAQLYLIDSCNVGIRPQRQEYINFFMPYVKEVNNGKHVQQTPAKPAITPAIAAHLVKKVKPIQKAKPQTKHKKKQKKSPKKKVTAPQPNVVVHVQPVRKPIRQAQRRPVAKPAPCPMQKAPVRINPLAAKALWIALNKQKAIRAQRLAAPFAYALFQKRNCR